jgi:uncharacterized membrane protein YtjA (UPF0391 family)
LAYNRISEAPIEGASSWIEYADLVHEGYDMFRRIFAFLPLFLLVGVACVAAVAAASPALAQIVFPICLGLFVVALADGISEREPERRE